MDKNSNIKALIVSVSSDIGHALAKRWRQRGIEVVGTYRSPSALVRNLESDGVKTIRCDMSNGSSVKKACGALRKAIHRWDHLVFCPGTLEPVGPLMQVDFSKWAKSLEVNFIRQIQMVHELLPSRNKKGKNPPVVLFFAGGGTNSATVNYSAYTVAKIALIKMCELLDAEIPDTKFVIVGPGWVKTKIHQETVRSGKKAGENFQKTKDKLSGDECTPMATVLDCCDWIIRSDRKTVSGRNFSVVFDIWGDPSLVTKLKKDRDMYKLRRQGNDWKKSQDK